MVVRRVLRLALLLYFALMLGLIGVRYLLVPHLDYFRPYIIQQLSQRSGLQVNMAELQGDWQGWNPRLLLKGLSIAEAGQPPLLELPRLEASISWKSLFQASLQLRHLDVQGLNIPIRRDARGHFWVMGQSFHPDDDSAPDDPDAWQGPARWLLQQRGIRIQGASLVWVDELRGAPELRLPDIELQMRYADGWHELGLQAQLPAGLGESLRLDARVRGERRLPAGLDLRSLPWEAVVQGQGVDVAGLRPWADVPQALYRGWADLRATARQAGEAAPMRVQASASLRDLGVQTEQGERLLLRQAAVEAGGTLEDIRSVAQGEPSGPLDWSVTLAQMSLRVPQVFARSLDLAQFSGQGHMRRDEQGRLALEDMDVVVRNRDLEATLGGRWRQDSRFEAGVADWSGRLDRLNLGALVHYLPLTVNPDARDWMAAGLVQGEVSQGSLMLSGGLDTFPYGLAPEDGRFEISGQLHDAIIDYQPARPDRPAWPRLEQVEGAIRMRNDNLEVDASQARMRIPEQDDIVMQDIATRIESMENHALLTLEGRSQAPAASYLGLLRHSPLDRLLDGVLSESRAQGDWIVPLHLQIPLNDVDQASVQGRIQMERGTFQYMPEAPPVTALKGELAFSEKGVSAQSLTGQLLGGPARIKGVLEPGKPGLRIDGEITSQGLGHYLNLKGAQRLQGRTGYSLLLTLDPKAAFGMTLESDLQGLALDFPEPLAKPADQAAALTARWSPDPTAKSDLLQLSLAGRQTLLVDMLRRQGVDSGPYFQGVAMGTPGLLASPERGTQVHAQYDRLDIDAWERVLLEFEQTPDGKPAPLRERPLFPELERVRLKAGQAFFIGMLLDELDLDSTQDAAGRMRLRLQARQVDGLLEAQRQQRSYVGLMTAKFSRLHVDKTRADWVQPEPEGQTVDDNLQLPAVSLQVDDLRMYGVELGRMQARGRPQDGGRQWLLDSFSLQSEGMVMQGTGKWVLRGEQRGLQLTALSDISNLGRFMDNSGLPREVLRDGSGTVQGALFWQDFPWTTDKARISGQVNVDLAKGRFLSVNSRSAKLLELLSLQSIARLSRLDVDLFGAAREGFPFDNLTGRMTLRAGKVELENYRVVGPAGTIRLQGQVDIQAETLDLTAVVAPNLDVSGAAIAAIFAVNPAVGVGAFLTQWLMQAPLSESLSVTYAVSGSIDDPQLKEVAEPPVPRRKPRTQTFIEP